MFYRKLICTFVGFGLLALVGCGAVNSDPAEQPAKSSGGGAPDAVVRAVPVEAPAKPARFQGEPIVIHGCRLTLVDRQEVPAERDGRILFIGAEVKPEDINKHPAGRLFKMEIPREMKKEMRLFRRLDNGDVVQEGDMVAFLDNRLANDDYMSKGAKVNAAKQDLEASIKTRDEAESRWRRLVSLRGATVGGAAKEEVDGAKLTYDRYLYEALSKKEAITLAEREQNQSKTVLDMHEIRSSTPGISLVTGDPIRHTYVIRQVYKKKGEWVKGGDPIMQIQCLDHICVEGLVGLEFKDRLKEGMVAVIEPSVTVGPRKPLNGHLAEVNSVAVSKDQKTVVSGGEDGRLILWDPNTERQQVLQHPSAVRAVACTPPGSLANLCLSGSADGKGRLWNLASVSESARLLNGQHRGPITCVAFSPDGKSCATGGEDREIMMWDTATGELRFRFPSPHRGAITALQFLPNRQLVSAGRDNTLQIWQWDEQAAKRIDQLDKRTGDVPVIGASPDGKRLLYDQGRTLSLLSLPGKVKEGMLQNQSGTSVFTTFAQFAPNGQLILTANASEGRMQLWRAPGPNQRGCELRQLSTPEHTTPTCASFSPDGSFLVSGTRERSVLIWPVPTKEEAEQQLIAPVRAVGASIDSSSRQVPIYVDLKNNGKLTAGNTATMVIYPQ